MSNRVKKEMLISEILDICPESVDIMLDAGLHCVGCSANSMESLEEGMKGHDFEDSDIEKMVKDINALLEKENEEKKPEEKDFVLEKIEELNKSYYKIAGLLISQKAYDTLHELRQGKSGLQIRLSAGGCAGYNLKYDFKDKAEEDEKTYKLSEEISLFINDFSFDKLHGAIVDFESGLHGSGLTFVNINSKKSCSCGTSFNF